MFLSLPKRTPRWLQVFLCRIEEESRQCEGREWTPSSGWINHLIPGMLAAQTQGSCLPEIFQVSLPRKKESCSWAHRSKQASCYVWRSGKGLFPGNATKQMLPCRTQGECGELLREKRGARTTVLDISLPRP